MPYINLPDLSLWYITNARDNTVDTSRPTILLLHPLLLDSSFLELQFNDPRLNERYNLVAIDLRSCGKTKNVPVACRDSYVDAADLAFAHEALSLPPCHVFACQAISVLAAQRFALLFPQRCLSLALISVPPLFEEVPSGAYDALLDQWPGFSNDSQTDFSISMFNNDMSVDLRQRILEFWKTQYGPQGCIRLQETMNVILSNLALSSRELELITQPVLIVHGESASIYSLNSAEDLSGLLTNAKGGAKLFVVKGAPDCLSVLPSFASVLNRVYGEFLRRLPGAHPSPTGPLPAIGRSLHLLAELVKNPAIGKRDPTSSLSFSRLSRAIVAAHEHKLSVYTAAAVG